MKWIEENGAMIAALIAVASLMIIIIMQDIEITKLKLEIQIKQDTIQVDGMKYIKMKPITLTQ